jgi:hypothetical protein
MKSIFIWLFVLILIAFGALYILSSESKKEKNKSHLFCEGEFIKNDIHGNPCYVEDRLRITRPRIYFKRNININ